MKKTLSFFVSILLSFFASLLFLHANTTASKSIEYREFLSNTNSDIIVFYDNHSNFNNDFYYMNRVYSVYHETDKLPVDILMLKNEVKYSFFDDLDLKENEVLVSKNISQKYGIRVGNKIVNKSALSSEDNYYTVKDYIDSSYSISVEYFSENTGLIIFGKSDSAIDDNLESVAFLKNEDALNAVHVNKIVSIKKIYRDLNSYSTRAFALNLLSQIVILVIIVFVLLMKDLSLIRKDIILGFSEKELLKRYCLPYFLLSVCSVISHLAIPYILNIVINHLYFFDVLNLFSLVIPVAIVKVQVVIVKLKIRRV